ncbi:MAG: PQQ-binding-like beta-propeller repeat protein [Phycisphaerae bacterium]|nr:PQQ-binding-like beta-propeller repeat protein [Phycisphaerae bacterium]
MKANLAVRASFGLTAFLLAAPALGAEKDWGSWAGPSRDFSAPEAALADSWPSDGPKKLWTMDVKGGYACIPVVDGVAYIAGRDGDTEMLIAADAKTGEKKWEYKYDAAVPKDFEFDTRFGYGPNSTPTVLGDRVVMIGHLGHMTCVDKSGKLLWKHDLHAEYAAPYLHFGYSASPVVYKDTLITLVGGKGNSIVAFDPKDGKVVWNKMDYEISYGSPQIMAIGGKDVLVTQVLDNTIACNPTTGELLWSAPREYQYNHNAASPVWCGDGNVFVGTPDKNGSSGFYHLEWKGDKLEGTEVWTSKIGMVHQNVLATDKFLLSSSSRPKSVLGLDPKTGEKSFTDREFGHSNFVRCGNRLIALEEDGTLRLCELKEDGIKLLASHDFLGDKSWAAPTVVGTRVYIRDASRVVALDLGAPAAAMGR